MNGDIYMRENTQCDSHAYGSICNFHQLLLQIKSKAHSIKLYRIKAIITRVKNYHFIQDSLCELES